MSAYVDGELEPAQRGAVVCHLADCWDCSSDAETLRLMKHSLRRLGRRRAPELALRRLQRIVVAMTSGDREAGPVWPSNGRPLLG